MKLLFWNKMPRTSLFLIGIFLYFIAALFKFNLGADERVYLKAGEYFLQHFSYTTPKYLPMYGIAIALVHTVIHSPLWSGDVLYALLGGLITIPLFSIAKHFLEEKIQSFSVLLVVVTPGLIVLPLYAGTHLLFILFAYAGIAVLLNALDRSSFILSLCAGILLGLSYLTRMDGLVFLCLMGLGLIVTSFHTKKNLMILLGLLIGTAIIATPWHIWLYYHGKHIISSVAHGGWEKGSTWKTPGIMYYLFTPDGQVNWASLKHPTNLISTLARSTLIYSENLSSLRFIPIFLWMFAGLGLMKIKWNKHAWLLFVPVIASLAYLPYYVLTRYLTGMLPMIVLIAAPGVSAFNDWLKEKINFRYFSLLLIAVLLLFDLSYCMVGHPTENTWVHKNPVNHAIINARIK